MRRGGLDIAFAERCANKIARKPSIDRRHVFGKRRIVDPGGPMQGRQSLALPMKRQNRQVANLRINAHLATSRAGKNGAWRQGCRRFHSSTFQKVEIRPSASGSQCWPRINLAC
jgi:hypothetical protein